MNMTKKNKSSAVYKETEKRKNSGIMSLLWMILGLVIAVALAAAVYYSPLFDGYRSDKITVEDDAQVTPMAKEQKVLPSSQDLNLGQYDPSREMALTSDYEFYDILPKQNFRSIPEGVSVQEMANEDKVLGADAVVKLEKEETKEAQIQIIEDATTYDGQDESGEKTANQTHITYILQIKSYTNAKDADEKRAQVMLAGVDAIVVRRLDRQTNAQVYQVVSMPMVSRQEASDALFKLRNNGIDALMVEQRRR
ncbi:SPOR domain-containing protein [Moraxella sp. ZY200743]|uniref:SPOR domain-containing protein n=1 Tax=Moraxella sp. ZY200743 TaxID=2911970 RepID=UPI003D7E81FE